MDFERLPILLLPLEVWFPGLFEEDICEVPEEWITLLWAWDVRDGDTSVSAVEQAKEAHDCSYCSRMQERGLEDIFE